MSAPVSQHGLNKFTVTHHLSEIWVWELTNLVVVRELKGCENLCGFECYIFLAHFVKICIPSKKKKRKNSETDQDYRTSQAHNYFGDYANVWDLFSNDLCELR